VRLSLRSGEIEFGVKLRDSPRHNKLTLLGGSIPALEINVNGNKLQAVIDTGAQLTTVSQNLVEQLGSKCHITKQSLAKDASGSQSPVKIFQ